MRKYGKLLLVLAVLAAVPAVASADGFLGGRQQTTSAGNPAQKTRNQQQAEQVKAAMQNARIDGYGISIEAIEGVVKLNGNVRNPDHVARAGEVCQRLPGITRVVNELEYTPQVEPRGKSRSVLGRLSRRSKRPAPVPATRPAIARVATRRVQPAIRQVRAEAPPARTNQQIAEHVGGSLKQFGLAGQPISIHFRQGVVTLSGGVNSSAQRASAEEAAGRVPGVIMVRNQLEVPRLPVQTAFGSQQYAPNTAPVSYGRPVSPAGFPQPAPPVPSSPYAGPPMALPSQSMSQVPATPVAMGGASMVSHPRLPSHAWPAYAQYPNSAAVTYPTQYSASAFPYIGPFYPYPQVPLGWREAKLQWDDGFWNLNFNKSESVWDVLYNPSGK